MGCDSTCGACEVNATNCVSCNSGLFLATSVCTANCPDGYYNNQNTHKCSECNVVCKTCTNSTSSDCIACKDSLYRYNNQCLDTCPTGTFFGANRTCTACTSNCSACSSVSYCQVCQGDLVLQSYVAANSQLCLSYCDDGYFNSSGYCKPCASGCK